MPLPWGLRKAELNHSPANENLIDELAAGTKSCMFLTDALFPVTETV